MDTMQIVNKLWATGHFANPALPDLYNVEEKDLPKLTVNDAVVKQALASYQAAMILEYDRAALEHYERRAIIDGELGPATEDLLKVERCGCPDFGYIDAQGKLIRGTLPAVGTGGWAKCHNIGNFHAALVYVNKASMPAFLQPVWPQVWANVVQSYDRIGLHFIETDDPNNHNTSLTWVRPDGGWIGLAIVGRNQSCNSKIWSRYDQNYKGGSSTPAIIQQWTTLVKHELGHNCGLEHSRGGVMNPSIVNGLPVLWDGDPSLNLLNRWFGGEAYNPPQPPQPPDNPNPPVPPTQGNAPVASIQITVPANCPPGVYSLVSTPKPGI